MLKLKQLYKLEVSNIMHSLYFKQHPYNLSQNFTKSKTSTLEKPEVLPCPLSLFCF